MKMTRSPGFSRSHKISFGDGSLEHSGDLLSGVVAQLVEHLLCKQRVASSNLAGSTKKKSPWVQ